MPGILLTLLLTVCPAMALALGPAYQACMASERFPGERQCACAQELADSLLTAADQEQAASIIADPDRFQTINQRKSSASDAFIERYRTWGGLVAERCAKP